MKILHIVDGPPLHTNCFLLVGSGGHAAAVDPAADARRFTEALRENGATLTHIFLTHGHHDHVGSVEALRKQYGAKVYIAQPDAGQFGIVADEYFVDGGSYKVDDMDFEVITTPGHTAGSVCIVCGDLLFSGDTLFAGDIGRTDFPGGSPRAMKESLRKLKERILGDLQVLPGHEEFSTMNQEKQHNYWLRGA